MKIDNLVVGAGSAGITIASGLTKTGKNVVLVSQTIGGDCTHTGCVPSKRFLFLAKQYTKATGIQKKDLHKNAFQNIRLTIQRIEKHDQMLLEKATVPFIQGSAKFTGRNTVSVQASDERIQTIQFKKCYIATGSSPLKLIIPGLPDKDCISSETVFKLNSLPSSIVIFGGGPIGVEMATAFSQFDTSVTMVVRSRILPNEPVEIAQMVRKNLESFNVAVHEEIKDQKYDSSTKMLTLHTTDGRIVAKVESAEKYLFALGRTPNTALDLEKAGVEYDRSGIVVSGTLQTSNSNISALGDVTPKAKFTHLAYNQGKFLTFHKLFPFLFYGKPTIPAVTFSNPPVASVGLTRETTFVKQIIVDFGDTDRALIEQSQPGKGFVYVNMLSGQIMGASLLGTFAEHLIPFFTLAVRDKKSLLSMWNFITPYPTYSNGFDTLFTSFLTRFRSEIKENVLLLLTLNRFRILLAIFWIGIAVSLVLFLNSIQFDTQKLVLTLFNLFTSPGGIFLFILVYTLRSFISFSAVLLSLLGGVLYGFWGGLFLTIFASNLSSSVAYIMGKTLFSSSVTQSEPSFRQTLRSNAFEAVLIARLSFFPYDLLSYICGGIRIPFLPFILATIIGSIPGTVAFTSIGAGIQNIEDLSAVRLDLTTIIIGIVVMVLSIIGSRIIKKIKLKNKL